MKRNFTQPLVRNGPESCFAELDDDDRARIEAVPLKTAAGTDIQPGDKVSYIGGIASGPAFSIFNSLPGFEITYVGQIEMIQNQPPSWFDEPKDEDDWKTLALFEQDFMAGSCGWHHAFVIGTDDESNCLFFIDEEQRTRIIETTNITKKTEPIAAA